MVRLALTAPILNPLAAYQSEEDGNDCDYQEDMYDRSCTVYKESKCPCDHQDHCDNIK